MGENSRLLLSNVPPLQEPDAFPPQTGEANIVPRTEALAEAPNMLADNKLSGWIEPARWGWAQQVAMGFRDESAGFGGVVVRSMT